MEEHCLTTLLFQQCFFATCLFYSGQSCYNDKNGVVAKKSERKRYRKNQVGAILLFCADGSDNGGTIVEERIAKLLADSKYSILLTALQAEGCTNISQLKEINLWSFMNQRRIYPLKERYEIWSAVQSILQGGSTANRYALIVDNETFTGDSPSRVFSAFLDKAARRHPLQIRNLINRSFEGRLILTRTASAFSERLSINTLSAYIDATLSPEWVMKYTEYVTKQLSGRKANVKFQQVTSTTASEESRDSGLNMCLKGIPSSITMGSVHRIVNSWDQALIISIVLLSKKKSDCCDAYLDTPFFTDGTMLLSKKHNQFLRSHSLTTPTCKLNLQLKPENVLYAIAKIAIVAGIPWETIAISVKQGGQTYNAFQLYIANLDKDALYELKKQKSIADVSINSDVVPSVSQIPTVGKSTWTRSRLVLDAQSDVVYLSYARFDYERAEPTIVVMHGYSNSVKNWLQVLEIVVNRLLEVKPDQLDAAILKLGYESFVSHNTQNRLFVNKSVVSTLKPVKMISIAYHLVRECGLSPEGFGIKCVKMLRDVQSAIEEKAAVSSNQNEYVATVGEMVFSANSSKEALKKAADYLMKSFRMKLIGTSIRTPYGRVLLLRLKGCVRHGIKLESGYYLYGDDDFEQNRKTLQELGELCRVSCQLICKEEGRNATPNLPRGIEVTDTSTEKQGSQKVVPSISTVEAQQKQKSNQENHVAYRDRFFDWMMNVAALAEGTCKTYRSSLLSVSQYAIKEGLTTKLLIEMTDPIEMQRIANQLENSAKFLRWDNQHGLRFRPVVRKFRDFAQYLAKKQPSIDMSRTPVPTQTAQLAIANAIDERKTVDPSAVLNGFSRWLSKVERLGPYMCGKHVRCMQAIDAYTKDAAGWELSLLQLSPEQIMKAIDQLLAEKEFHQWATKNVPDTAEILQKFCEYLADQGIVEEKITVQASSPEAKKPEVVGRNAIPTSETQHLDPGPVVQQETEQQNSLLDSMFTRAVGAPSVAATEAYQPSLLDRNVIQAIKDSDMDGIQFEKLYNKFNVTRHHLQSIIEADKHIIDFGGRLMHEDALIDWPEAQPVIDTALTKLLAKVDIVARKMLYEAVRFELSMFFNDNDLDSEEQVYHLARHMYEKNHYLGKRYWFYGNQNICKQEQRDGVSNLDILVDYARSKQGLVSFEEATEYFVRIGKNANSLRTQLLTDTKPRFLLYRENEYLSVEALQLCDDWYHEARQAMRTLLDETDGFVIFRDIGDGFFDRLPRLPYGLTWTHLLLQQLLRFWGKRIGARTIAAYANQSMSTIHAFLVAADTDIHTFADGVALWVALEQVEERRYQADELRELLRERGIIANNELYSILHKALANDSRFAWDHEMETVMIRR